VNNVDVQLNNSQTPVVRRINTSKIAQIPEKKNLKSISKIELLKKPSIKVNHFNYMVYQNKNKNFYSDKKAKKFETLSMIYSHCDLEVKISKKNSFEKQTSKQVNENRVNSNVNSYESIENKMETNSTGEGLAFIENCQIVNFVELSPQKK
jgi:hypothetical protein